MKNTSFYTRIRSNVVMGEKGVAAIEFALVLPVLLLLLVGGIEITRFVLANQKVDKVAAQMADFISQVKTPNQLLASGPELTATFEKLMSPFGSADAGFVMSVIGINPANEKAEISYQTENNATSEIGGTGTPISPDDIGGIALLPRDTLIAVEVRYKHTNVLSGLLESLSLSPTGQGVKVDGTELYKKAIYRYRLDNNLLVVNPNNGAMPAEPAVCGYYRDADNTFSGTDDDENANDKVDRNPYDIDITSANVDVPHPCQCYKQMLPPAPKNNDVLIQKLKTCRPALLAAPYNCPSRDETYNSIIPNNLDNSSLNKYSPICCGTADPITETCFGCIDEDDKFVEPTDPESGSCPQPKPSPPPEPPCTVDCSPTPPNPTPNPTPTPAPPPFSGG